MPRAPLRTRRQSTLAKRGHLDLDHVEPTERIFAESALFDREGQVRVGRRDESNVDRDLAIRAHRTDRALLQRPQELGLKGYRKLPNLVEKEGATASPLEKSAASHNLCR
jgi:hypothetical protein